MVRRQRTAGSWRRRRRRISSGCSSSMTRTGSWWACGAGSTWRPGSRSSWSVRWLGTFLEDPLDVPGEVLDFVAGQLGIADPSVVKQYAERVKTKSDHQQEIRRKYGLRDFADAEAELAEWVTARAWTSGDGPKAIFLDAMTWLRERKVLLPGVTTLVRLVARVRDETTHRLWRVLEALLTPAQRRVLDRLLEVPMTWSPCSSATGTRPRWGRRSRCTGGSSRPCTSSATSTPTSPTGATSRASATCKRA